MFLWFEVLSFEARCPPLYFIMEPILDYYSKKSEAVGSFKVPGNGDVFERTAAYNGDDKGEERVILHLSCFVFPISIN